MVMFDEFGRELIQAPLRELLWQDYQKIFSEKYNLPLVLRDNIFSKYRGDTTLEEDFENLIRDHECWEYRDYVDKIEK